jgi:hypothetical protein
LALRQVLQREQVLPEWVQLAPSDDASPRATRQPA